MKFTKLPKQKIHEAVANPDARSQLSFDREQLGKDYKAALQLKADSQHAGAIAVLRALRAQLPKSKGRAASTEEVAGQSWRDQAWARHLRYLCDLSLAECLQAVGKHAEAIGLLLPVLSCSESEEFRRGGGMQAKREWLLWDGVADSAAQAEDWAVLKLSCEKCLQVWPQDLGKLRSLIRALLRLGLDEECALALEALKEIAEGSDSQAFGQREAWLLQQLHFQLGEDNTKPMAGEFEADYDTLCEQRRKRLRTEATYPAVKAKQVLIREVSLSLLLEECRKLCLLGLPLNHPVIFVRQSRGSAAADARIATNPGVASKSSSSSSLEGHRFGLHTRQSPQAQSEMPEEALAAAARMWDALDPLLAEHGHRRGGSHWIPSLLKNAAAPRTSLLQQQVAQKHQEAAFLEERSVEGLLGIPETGTGRQESPSRSLLNWLLRITVFALEHQRLVEGKEKGKLISCTVQLAVSMMMSSSPTSNFASTRACLQASESLQDWHGESWLNDSFFKFLGCQDENPSEAGMVTKPARQIRIFLRKYGLALAELCAASQLRHHWVSQMGTDFLQVWLRLNGIDARAFTSPGSDQILEEEGSLQKLPRELLERMQADKFVCESIVRCLWCWASLRKPAEAITSLLQLCQEALGVCKTEVRSHTGIAITSSACAHRISARKRLSSDPEILIEDDGARERGNLIEQCQLLLEVRLPNEYEPWSQKLTSELEKLLRLTHEFLRGISGESHAAAFGAGSEQSSSLAILLEVFARIMSHLVVGFCNASSRTDRDVPRMDKLTRVLRCCADLVEVAQRRSDLVTTRGPRPGDASSDAAPIFLRVADTVAAADGKANGSQADTVCGLAQPCESMVLACLMIADLVASGKMVLEFCPVAHASISMAMKLCGILLLAAEAAPRCGNGQTVRGGVLIVCESLKPSVAASSDENIKVLRQIPPRTLWLHLCRFLVAGQDLAMILGTVFNERLRTAFLEVWHTRELTLKLFGPPRGPGESVNDARLCTTLETPLSLTHIICTCALRVGCDTLAAWRKDLTSWRERASENSLAVAANSPIKDVEKSTTAQTKVETVRVCNTNGKASNQRQIDQRPAWRKTLRALRGADGEAPARNLEFKDDEEVDEATCDLFARALVCLFRLPGVDPSPPPNFPSNPVCRFLMDGAVFRTADAVELSEAAKSYEDVLHHPLAPHVLLLAQQVHQRLLRTLRRVGTRSPASPSEFLQILSVHLDTLLFPDAYAGRSTSLEVGDPIPQAFFHPLLMTRLMLRGPDGRTTQGMEAAFKDADATQTHACSPYLSMMRRLRAQAADPGAGAAGGFPQKLLNEGLPGLAVAFQRIDDQVQDFCGKEWVPPPPERNPAEWLDEQDLFAGRKLLEFISKMPVLAVPGGLKDVYSELVMAVNVRHPSKPDGQAKETKKLFETIALAAKSFLLKPCDWESWTKIASIFKWLYNAYDDEVAKHEPWTLTFQLWLQGSSEFTFHWQEDLQAFYNHARLLNLMLLARLEDELSAEIGKTANCAEIGKAANGTISEFAAGTLPSEIASGPSRQAALAQAWLERELDLLELYRCRRLSLELWRQPEGRERQKTYRLVQRCDQISRRVLWFLVHCTDIGEKMPEVAMLIEKHMTSWPKPSFVQQWGMNGRRPEALLNLTRGQPAPYLWNVPYIAARCQWKLSQDASCPTVGPDGVLTLLSAAVEVEKWIFHQRGERQYEPAWKFNTMMLKIISKYSFKELKFLEFRKKKDKISQETIQDVHNECFRALEDIANQKTSYKFFLVSLKAKFDKNNNMLGRAARRMREGMFSVPKDFPLDGTKLGLLYLRDAGSYSQASEDLCWQRSRRYRLFNLKRAKALMFIVNLARVSLKKVIEQGDPFSKSRINGIHSSSDAVVKIITGLSEQRPAAWEEMHDTMGLLVMLLRGFYVPGGQKAFWTAFNMGFQNCVGHHFKRLLDPRSERCRPCLDWQLLAQLRAVCFALKASDQDKSTPQEMLRKCFVTAMSDVKSYLQKSMALPEELTAVKSQSGLEEAEAFFKKLASKMPTVSGRWGSSQESFEESREPARKWNQQDVKTPEVCHVADSDSE
mmetsp:Transcript_53008/g.99596  ORF Transcript_53008/g.99596 Transcript_53008/m.99596 type:complete len:2075 (-) Transcript_53008:158-6382(-)